MALQRLGREGQEGGLAEGEGVREDERQYVLARPAARGCARRGRQSAEAFSKRNEQAYEGAGGEDVRR